MLLLGGSTECYKASGLAWLQVAAYDSNTTAQRLEARAELVLGINDRLDELEQVKSDVYALAEVEALLLFKSEFSLDATAYNLMTWHGGKDAYQCALPARASTSA